MTEHFHKFSTGDVAHADNLHQDTQGYLKDTLAYLGKMAGINVEGIVSKVDPKIVESLARNIETASERLGSGSIPMKSSNGPALA